MAKWIKTSKEDDVYINLEQVAQIKRVSLESAYLILSNGNQVVLRCDGEAKLNAFLNKLADRSGGAV